MCNVKLDSGALALIEYFESAGYEAYAVGGCVRDAIMERPVFDTDIAVSCPPDITERVLEDNGVRFFETGIKHGTVTALIDKTPYELTTFRVDGGYSDHRRPDGVTFVSRLNDDLARRDFTVNAIAYSPRTGLVDPFGGVSDIKARVLRAVGDPAKRFEEDALRILRGMRFCAVLDFTVEHATAAAMRAAAPLLSSVARERVTTELVKLLGGAAAARALREFREILPFIHPALAAANEPAFRAIDALPCSHLLRLAALLVLVPDGDIFGLRLSGGDSRYIVKLASAVCDPLPRDRAGVKRVLNGLGSDLFGGWCALRAALYGDDPTFARQTARNVIENGEPYRLCDLTVSGDDLKELGVSGKKAGAALRELLELVIKEELPNDREAMIGYVKNKREDVK